MIDVHHQDDLDNRNSDKPGFLGVLVMDDDFVERKSGGCRRTNVSVGVRMGSRLVTDA